MSSRSVLTISATEEDRLSSANRGRQPMPARQATVICWQGSDFSSSPCIIPTQSMGIVASAVSLMAVSTAGLAATVTVCPNRPSKTPKISANLCARLMSIFSTWCRIETRFDIQKPAIPQPDDGATPPRFPLLKRHFDEATFRQLMRLIRRTRRSYRFPSGILRDGNATTAPAKG